MDSNAAPDVEVPDADRVRHRVVGRVLAVIASVAFVSTVLALASAFGGVPIPVLGHDADAANPLVRLAPGTLLILLLALSHRHGFDRLARLVTLALPLVALPSTAPEAFSIAMPQVIWVPILIASSLTSTRWTMVVAATTAVVLAVCFGHEIAGLGIGPWTTTIVLLVTVIGGRMLHDRLIEASARSSAKATELALYDPLTSLPNRTLLVDRIHEGIKKTARTPDWALAVLMVDLDGFSEVNDSLGHKAGDAVLAEAAKRIRQKVRTSDTVARFGGDEFSIVLADVADRAAIDRIAVAIQKALAAPIVVGNERIELTASVGVAVFPDDGQSAEELLQQADHAVMTSKSAGPDRVSYFTRTLQESAETRRRLVADLREALPQRQLEVHYQPIIDLRTGQVHHAEALVRWRHPTRGMVSPAAFIPIAESTGLINEIGEFVFREACTQSLRWREASGHPFKVGVNRSPVQFRGGVAKAQTWPEHLASVGLPGDGVAVEVTEGLLLDDKDGIDQQLEALRAAGMSVALDDFGTGYSALAYLQKYRFDYLKIDRAFVRDLGKTASNAPLCRAMITMAHDMGMKVVAEGIETEQQRELLVQMGCDYGQGFLFAKPMPASDFDAFLARGLLKASPNA